MLCVASPTGIMGGCAQSDCFASAFVYQLPNTVLGALAEDIQHSQHGGCDQMLDDIIHGAHMLASHLQRPLCKIVDKSGRLQILKTLGCRFHLPKYGRPSNLANACWDPVAGEREGEKLNIDRGERDTKHCEQGSRPSMAIDHQAHWLVGLWLLAAGCSCGLLQWPAPSSELRDASQYAFQASLMHLISRAHFAWSG